MIGQTLGHYEILGSLGKGGMGEVWRARDSRLGREVAIKTLPRELASDADRLARFEREAKLLATLNHAHIAAIYGLDEHEGIRFLAMELIEGQTLEDRLKDGPLPQDEALRLALQIAQALEAAHEKGVVHRDLKPANVMIARDVVKVLDFGLAKAFSGRPEEASPAHSPALSLAMTQQGIILGTAAYMSPEQASGQGTDQRADIWAFGVVLYEMLTGMPLFSGESVPHVLADVLRAEPDWKRLPESLHPRVKLLLERCLVKKPRNRYHAIADVRIDLEQVLADPRGLVRRDDRHSARASRPLATRLAGAAGLLVVGALVAGFAALALWPAPETPLVTRFSYPLESVNSVFFPTISRDGTRMAAIAGNPPTVQVLSTNEFEARAVPETAIVALSPPCFSPDSSWMAYPTNEGVLRKAPVAGGRGVSIVQGVAGLTVTCHWGDDGFVYFAVSSGGIMRVPENGGTVEAVTSTRPDSGEVLHVNPALLPGGRMLLYSAVTSIDTASTHTMIHDFDTGQDTVLLSNSGISTFAPSSDDPYRGHIIFGQAGALFAAPVDLRARRAGSAAPILEGVLGLGGFTVPAVSATGTLAYLARDQQGDVGVSLALLDRSGAEQPLDLSPRLFENIMFSPDGARAAVMVFSVDNLSGDIWIYELDGGRFTLLTADAGFSAFPAWSANGRNVMYAQAPNMASSDWSMVTEPADNSAPPVLLGSFPGTATFPLSAAPDGKTLLGVSVMASGRGDIWTLPLDDIAAETPATSENLDHILATDANEQHAMFSPDGRWIAYSSDETGRDEVYVVPFPGPGGKSQISIGGGRQPRWNPAGGEIFYLTGSILMAVPYEVADNAFRPGAPGTLFDTRIVPGRGHASAFVYDVTPDGDGFLMQRPGPAGESAQLRVVQNWIEELREQVPFAGIPR